jgi:hypothetical protein
MDMPHILCTNTRNGKRARVIINITQACDYIETFDDQGEPNGMIVGYGKDHYRKIDQIVEQVVEKLKKVNGGAE